MGNKIIVHVGVVCMLKCDVILLRVRTYVCACVPSRPRTHESFLHEIFYFTVSQKFSPSKVSRCMVYHMSLDVKNESHSHVYTRSLTHCPSSQGWAPVSCCGGGVSGSICAGEGEAVFLSVLSWLVC